MTSRRGEPALHRARDVVRQRGWVLLEQDEQLLQESLDHLADFDFRPEFPPDLAYVAYCLDGDLREFRTGAHRVLLRLPGTEGQPLFNRVLLPDPRPDHVDLLWEAAAAAGTSSLLSGVSSDPGRLNFTLAQRRFSIDLDGGAVQQIIAGVTPSTLDLIRDGERMYCWVRARRSGGFLELLRS